MELKDYLAIMVANNASDIYLTAGAPPSGKFEGRMKILEREALEPGRVREIAYSILSDAQIREFEEKLEMNLAISETGVGRFRVNIFMQRGQCAMVIRSIKVNIPSMDSLGLPDILRKLVMSKRGLILFVGATGSGKSTSLASLIDYRNTNSTGHIITVEDPIEFMHRHKRSIVNQREVGVDTLTYEDALKNTLRQAPDVILIGEIRSQETMEHAIAFAETGHLAFSTLHANNANQALDRIINFFPEERRNQLLLDLSLNLRAMVSQRLVPGTDGKRVAAFEILLNSPLASQLIKKGEVSALKDLMEKSGNVGMETFDGALLKLYAEGRIALEEALKNADSENNLRLKINLWEKEKGLAPDVTPNFTIEEADDGPKPPRAGGMKLELE
ncbi:MAG: PilT/PilU family type 4a pilus ATPase [Chromatiales bacterium]|nr:PilT/PilU family type 4a pilus ATPase [Chromatiales bacterium]